MTTIVPTYATPIRDANGKLLSGDLPLWSGQGEPPAVGDVVTTRGVNPIRVTITGYSVAGIWLMVDGYQTENPSKTGNLAGAEIDWTVPFSKEAPLPKRQALEFGLNAAIPARVTAAWGARLIYPDDLVFNRQSCVGEIYERKALHDWLNTGPLKTALKTARQADERWLLSKTGRQQVVLYWDHTGVIVACPNASCGYLYVAAWLHLEDPAKQPADAYQPIAFEPEPWADYQADDADDWGDDDWADDLDR